MTLERIRATATGWALAGTLSVGAGAAFAQAPNLAEVAKKEQDRRKATPSPTKVYTSKDLPKPPAPPPTSAPAGAAAAPAPGAAAADPATEQKPGEEVKDEKWWREQMAALRDEVTRNEMFLEALQTRINSLAADYTSRDDPAQRARLSEDRQRALAMLDRVKADIDKTRKAIADLEEEARKAGVPPGWLR